VRRLPVIICKWEVGGGGIWEKAGIDPGYVGVLRE
jgi:hypothetical protein